MESFELLINEDNFLEESDICKLLGSNNKEEVLNSLNNIAFVFAKAFYEDDLKDQYNNFINLIKIYLDSNNESFKYNDLIEYLLKEVKVDDPLLEIRNSVVGYPDEYNLAVLGVLKALNYTNDVDIQEVTGLFYSLKEGCIDVEKSIQYYALASDQGDSLSQYNLGQIYIIDKNSDYYNVDLALKYLKMSLDNGYTNAASGLGFIYKCCEGYIDIPLAIKYFSLSIDNDNADSYSLNNLAYIYQQNETYKDIDKAIELLKKNIKYNNDKVAMNNLACIYDRVEGYINIKEAIKYYTLASEQNFASSQESLGVIYLTYNEYKDLDKAIHYLTLASNQGILESQHNLAYLYENEEDYINIDLAKKYYTLAADQGFVYSQNNLGLLYRKENDFDMAIKYLTCASEQGKAVALRNLGLTYSMNSNYKDIKKALDLLKEAGEKGYDYAIYEYLKLLLEYYSDSLENNVIDETKYWTSKDSSYAHLFLGQRYLEGDFVPLNFKKAFDEFNEAIKLNDKNDEAYYEIGTSYYYGRGVERDLVKAKEYLEIANKLGQSCEFILQLINDELGVSNEENYIASYLDKQQGFNTAIDIVDQLFKNVKLDKDIKTYLITALVSYFNFYENEKKTSFSFDYSPCISMLFKAMECVIRKYYIDDYREYLKDNVDPDELRQNKYFTYVNEYGEYDYLDKGKFDKFTLGDFKKLINLKNEPVTSFMYSCSNDSKETSIKKTIDRCLVNYSMERLFDKHKFSSNSIKSEINNYYISISNFINQFVDEVRNPATHTTVINREKAESMINYFLFSKKILTNFYRKLK